MVVRPVNFDDDDVSGLGEQRQRIAHGPPRLSRILPRHHGRTAREMVGAFGGDQHGTAGLHDHLGGIGGAVVVHAGGRAHDHEVGRAGDHGQGAGGHVAADAPLRAQALGGLAELGLGGLQIGLDLLGHGRDPLCGGHAGIGIGRSERLGHLGAQSGQLRAEPLSEVGGGPHQPR